MAELGKTRVPRVVLVLLGLIVILVAVAAVYLSWDRSRPPSVVVRDVVTPPETPDPSVEFARRLYLEQIESAKVIEHMAAGHVGSITIDEVKTEEESATLSITSSMVDGSSAEGIMSMARLNDDWYLHTITGLRRRGEGSYAGAVRAGGSLEESMSVEDAAAAAGIETFDQQVMSALLKGQGENQSLLDEVIDGTYDRMDFGEPEEGVGTVSVPVRLSGPKNRRTDARVVLIRKEIDETRRTFILALTK